MSADLGMIGGGACHLQLQHLRCGRRSQFERERNVHILSPTTASAFCKPKSRACHDGKSFLGALSEKHPVNAFAVSPRPPATNKALGHSVIGRIPSHLASAQPGGRTTCRGSKSVELHREVPTHMSVKLSRASDGLTQFELLRVANRAGF
jgi:hypothetical protein